MVQPRVTASLRSLLTLFALAGILSLAACGGGGGSTSNAYVPPVIPVTPPPLTVLPTSLNVFSGVPATLTITSGTAPFSAFSSNAAVLPVAQAASTTIPLLANTVNADTPVVITIQDASGQTANVSVTVKPSQLLPTSITITGNPVCGGSNAQLCSGQDGTATVRVSGVGGGAIAGRQVRFDVVLGTFSLITSNSAVPAQTVTVLTDQNGLAAVTLRVPVNAVTQFATLRATDVASGSNVIGQFTIAQFINGNAVLSVIPTGLTTFTGPDTQTCSSGAQANFYIFGGTPPYTVATNFPTALSFVGTPVQASGGAFTIVTNGTCFTGATFAITDAAGRTLLTPPTADNVLGTLEPTPPAPGDLVATPPSSQASPISVANCVAGNGQAQFGISGGTPKYFVVIAATSGITSTPVIAPQSGIAPGDVVKVSSIQGAIGSTMTLTVGDAGAPSKQTNVFLKCTS